jgi:hypothetical protein
MASWVVIDSSGCKAWHVSSIDMTSRPGSNDTVKLS